MDRINSNLIKSYLVVEKMKIMRIKIGDKI